MEQISLFDIEVKGVKSHWRWTGLYDKMCVMCKYSDDSEEAPRFCPGCKAVMIQPEPKNYDDLFPCNTCKWDIKGCCNYDIPHGRFCVLGDAWERR